MATREEGSISTSDLPSYFLGGLFDCLGEEATMQWNETYRDSGSVSDQTPVVTKVTARNQRKSSAVCRQCCGRPGS